MATSIPIDGNVRDRLKGYGIAGDSYSEILTRLMDEVDRRAFIAATRQRLSQMRDDDWVDLEDIA